MKCVQCKINKQKDFSFTLLAKKVLRVFYISTEIILDKLKFSSFIQTKMSKLKHQGHSERKAFYM